MKKEFLLSALFLIAVSHAQSIRATDESAAAEVQSDSTPAPSAAPVEEPAVAATDTPEATNAAIDGQLTAETPAPAPKKTKKARRGRKKTSHHSTTHKNHTCDPKILEDVMKQTEISKKEHEKEQLPHDTDTEKTM